MNTTLESTFGGGPKLLFLKATKITSIAIKVIVGEIFTVLIYVP